MKLFTKSEMQALENAAQAGGLPLSQMMDNAGTALAQEAASRFGPLDGRRVAILCGKGNNGGDGFVCARILAQMSADCTVLLTHGQPATELARAAFARLPGSVKVLEHRPGSPDIENLLAGAHIIIDCVYGFGFRGELDPQTARLFALCNYSVAHRVSADLPSGAECDTARVSPGTFRAHVTVAFTGEKLAHRCYPAMEFCGTTVLRQVGIPAQLTANARTRARLTGPELAAPLLAPPPLQAHKGSQGRLLLVCGSYGMAGACIMAARAALRCGAGLVHIAAEERLYPILAAAVPEAVFTVFDPQGPRKILIKAITAAYEACTACVAGCGLGSLAELLCPILFAGEERPFLLDADALNYCSHTGARPAPRQNLVLTPHPGEAARLTGRSVPELQRDRIGTAQALAADFRGTALLKGPGTVIAASSEELAINSTGNPGMAKGGSGDVLAGIIGSLLAQGADGFTAAAAGAWLHGAAGDLCRDKLSARAMLPTDLIEALPEVIRSLSPNG